jgi:hypothetical protein
LKGEYCRVQGSRAKGRDFEPMGHEYFERRLENSIGKVEKPGDRATRAGE